MKNSQNQYKLKAQNEHKLETSIRMMQYINMYNLRHDQIIYQCPIYKSNFIQENQEFDTEVQCVQEMADVEIIYKAERKQEFDKIRKQEKQILERIKRQEEEEKKKKGFFGKLFSSKSKSKMASSSLSPTKVKINDSTLKSSYYAKKNQEDQSQLLKSKINMNSESRLKHSQSIVIPVKLEPNQHTQQKSQQNQKSNNKTANESPVNNLKIKPSQSPEPVPKQKQNTKVSKKQSEQQQGKQNKQRTSKAFSQQELVQVDQDDLLDVNQSKDGQQIMPQIVEVVQSQAQSSDRQSKVSRVSLKDLQERESLKKQTSRMSKRSRKRIDSDEQQEQQKDSKPKIQEKVNMKKKSTLVDQKISKTSKVSQKSEKKISKQKPLKKKTSQKVKEKTPQNTKKKSQQKLKKKSSQKVELNQKQIRNKKKTKQVVSKQQRQQNKKKEKQQDVLSSYIQSQISRLTVSVKQKQDEQVSIQSLLDSLHESFNIGKSKSSGKSLGIQEQQKIEQVENKIDDSFSDVKINWMVKIEACDLQQKLLLNRLKQRWVQPLRNLDKLMDIRLEQLTPQIDRDPRLNWSKPNLNFGKIIE